MMVYSQAYWGMMGGFGFFFMILVWIALILLIIWLVRELQSPRRRNGRRN